MSRPSFLPDGRTRLLGILGRPLTHSLSPRLHTAVLRRLDRNLLYVPLPVPEARLERFLEEAPGMGIVGLNVTTPFKQRVAAWVRPRDRETGRTAVVNTIGFDRRGAWGTGTDGAGILRYLESLGFGGAPLGLLGFGAAGRSLTHRAWEERRGPLLVVTRRPDDVRMELDAWSTKGRGLRSADRPEVVDRDHLPERGLPRVWVSALPPAAGILTKSFWSRIPARSIFVDLNYGEGRTRHLERARAAGCRSADGLGPLLHQAALSLSLWLGDVVPVSLFEQASGASRGRLRPS